MGLRWRAERAVGRCRTGRPLYHGRRAPLYTAAVHAAAARRAPPHHGTHPGGAPRHPPPSPAPHTPPPRARYARGAVCALGPNRRFPPPRPHTAQRRLALRCTPRRLVAATAGNTMAAPPPSNPGCTTPAPHRSTPRGAGAPATPRHGVAPPAQWSVPHHATPRHAKPRHGGRSPRPTARLLSRPLGQHGGPRWRQGRSMQLALKASWMHSTCGTLGRRPPEASEHRCMRKPAEPLHCKDRIRVCAISFDEGHGLRPFDV